MNSTIKPKQLGNTKKIDPKIRGRIEKHLGAQTRYGGRVITYREFYSQVIAKGYRTIDSQTYDSGGTCYKLANGTGAFFDIPKIIHDNPEVIGLGVI